MAEESRFNSHLGQEITLFSVMSSPALGPTQSQFQYLPGDISLGLKRAGRETDHSYAVSRLSMRDVIYFHSPINCHVSVLN
jgi:hypothetical protein